MRWNCFGIKLWLGQKCEEPYCFLNSFFSYQSLLFQYLVGLLLLFAVLILQILQSKREGLKRKKTLARQTLLEETMVS